MTAIETDHPVVSEAEWLQARRALLEQEKQLTRQRDQLARARRSLPWVKVEQDYVFDGPHAGVTLSQLFEGRSQLMLYHFMFGPDWAEGCPSCSLAADNFDGALIHLAQRDTAFAMVSRAPVARLEAFKKRMGWKCTWVSSNRNSFNWDYHVSFTPDDVKRKKAFYNFNVGWFPGEEGQGLSAFYKDASGAIFHTYSAYARGVEGLLGTYDLLDMAPQGRAEDALPFPMAWIRHHDRYPDSQPAPSGDACCHAEHS